MQLIYTPALSSKDIMILNYIRNCFINIIRSKPSIKMMKELTVFPNLLCDSGGYQIYNLICAVINGKEIVKFIILPGAGNQKRNGVFIFDPIDLCGQYDKFDIKIGFTMDFPMVNGSEEEFTDHLSKSYECADIMFDCRPEFCSDTKLYIPLHFSSKKQLHFYFDTMATLSPDGYAFPVRDSTSWEYIMKIAYLLCFLHSQGVKRIHMFGSCKLEIIVIGAAAIGLKMFQRITFDSSTWDTARNNPPKYLHPNTLKQKDIRDLKVFRSTLPKSLIRQLKGHEKYLPRSYIYKLIVLNNVLTVNRLTQKITKIAEDVEQLKWFVKTSANFKATRSMLVHAIGLLQKGSTEEYKDFEKEFDYIWY